MGVCILYTLNRQSTEKYLQISIEQCNIKLYNCQCHHYVPHGTYICCNCMWFYLISRSKLVLKLERKRLIRKARNVVNFEYNYCIDRKLVLGLVT